MPNQQPAAMQGNTYEERRQACFYRLREKIKDKLDPKCDISEAPQILGERIANTGQIFIERSPVTSKVWVVHTLKDKPANSEKFDSFYKNHLLPIFEDYGISDYQVGFQPSK